MTTKSARLPRKSPREGSRLHRSKRLRSSPGSDSIRNQQARRDKLCRACFSIQAMNVLATLALLALSASPHSGQDTVRISLFSLFKPETIDIRIASGESASPDATGLAGSSSFGRGELIRIRL